MDLSEEELAVLEELSPRGGGGAPAGPAHAAAGGAAPDDQQEDAEDADQEPDVDDADVDDGDEAEAPSGGKGKAARGAAGGAAQRPKSRPSAPKVRGSSLQHLSVAMPLLFNSVAAASLLKQSTVTELLKQCATPARDANAKDKANGKGEVHTHAVPHDHDEHLRAAPYHIEADNRSACAACLKQALIPAYSQAHHLNPTPLPQLEYALKQQALASLSQSRWAKARDTAAAPTPSSTADVSVLSQLLLNYLGPASEPPSSTNAVTSIPPDPRFLAILHTAMLNQSPFSIDLSSSEEQFYTRISSICLAASSASSSHPADSPSQLRETLLKFWLGRGSVQQTFDALNFLIRDCASSPPLQLTTFLSSWQQLMRSRKQTILRVSRLKHMSEIASCARRVQLICSATPSTTPPTSNPTKRPGRTWSFESDGGWLRLDERVCAILEEAYQGGKPAVEYTIDAQGYTYRADLLKMTQKNLQTGRERPLRCLLALMIKEKGGRVSQTVEINMPHDTLIRELRNELANYLRWDEKLLRMTYGGKVLRKGDYEHVSIREAIVPLGSEPLTVTKLLKGDLEEMCTFTVTGPNAFKQPLFECVTCMGGFLMCAVCAAQCHRGHETRPVSGTGGSGAFGFCCCGAGAGSNLAACKSLEELPDDAETFYGPHMTVSTTGDFIFIISTEHGLLKVGTGSRQSITGKLYSQNTHMSAHAGAQLACVRLDGDREVLLMRTPVLGSATLLHIDVDTLLFTGQRTMLPAPDQAAGSAEPASFSAGARSWQLEYTLKSDATDSSEPADASMLGEDGEPVLAIGWNAIPPALLSQVKSVLCTNWQYGHVCWLTHTRDSGLMSLVLEEEGMMLRLPSKLGVRRCRARLRHHEHIMPLFTREQQLCVLQLTTPQTSEPTLPASVAPRVARQYGLALDVFQMPTLTSSAPATPYCRSCLELVSTSSTTSSLTSSFSCPRCDGAAFSLTQMDEEKKSSEPSLASLVSSSPNTMQRQLQSHLVASLDPSRESGPSLPPSLPASPMGNSLAYSAALALQASLPAPLPAAASSPAVTPPTASPVPEVAEYDELLHSPMPSVSPSPSPSVSPLGLEFAVGLASSIPAGDAFFEHAWSSANALPSSMVESSSPLLVSFSHATFVRRTILEAAVGLYKQFGSSSDSPSAVSKKHICDGCGGSGAPVRLPDGSLAPASGSLSRLSVCLDRACSDSTVLCKWCALMGNWRSKSHLASHAMQRVDTDAELASTAALPTSPSTGASLFPPTYELLHMGEFASYIDFARGVLVVLRSPSQITSSASHRESCLLFDCDTGVCTTKPIYIKTRGDCFILDESTKSVWAFASAGARLERWECLSDQPDETPTSVPPNGDTLLAIDAATIMLRELPALASSPSIMTLALEQLHQLLEFVMAEANSTMRLAHPQLTRALLGQLRAQLANWNIQVNPLHTATATPSAITDLNASAFATVIEKLAPLLESALGLPGSMPSLASRATRSPARRTLFSDTTNAPSASLSVAWPSDLQSQAADILVEGFESFYPTMKQRALLLSSLMDAAAATSSDSSSCPIPEAPRLLRLLAERYRLAYVGLKHVGAPVAGTASAETQDSTLLTQTVQNLMHTWIELMSESDIKQVERGDIYDRAQWHVATPHVLAYLNKLMQLVSFVNQPHIASALPAAINRPLRSASGAFVKLATIVLQHAAELVQAAEQKQAESLPNEHEIAVDDSNTALARDAAAAESTLRFLHESSIGELLSWVMLSLAEVQIDKLAVPASSTSANSITQLLKSCIALMCILSALQTRALKVSRVDQADSLLTDHVTPNRTRIRLGDTRRKIGALRHSNQLLTLRSLHIAPTPTVRGAAPRRSKNTAQQPLYALTPAAAEVFTEIFFEFATQYQAVPSSGPGLTSPGWALGRAAMSRSDLATFFRKRGAHSAETAMQRATLQCTKYGRLSATMTGSLSVRHPLAFGDEAALMSLHGFLSMVTDLAVENSRRLLRDLRVLELRHSFGNTHHAALHLLPDLKVAFTRVLDRLFAQAPDAAFGLPGMAAPAATPTLAAAALPSYPQTLRARTVDELVNIVPGSGQMSSSLRAVAAVASSAALAAAAAAASGEVRAEVSTAASFPQEVILKLLNSQESFNRQAAAAKSKLAFLTQFVAAPAAEISASLPVRSPIAQLSPTLVHEVYAEDVASSLVGESSTKKHAAMLTASTAESHAFSDALCVQRLSELFQRCIKEAAPQGVGTAIIQPDLMQQPAPKSLLATLAMLGGDRTPPSASSGGISAAAALFLCEKLFACALIKHNGLSDECIAYARSLELYRLLSSNQTKNVRLLTSPACPEFFRKVVRATARFVRMPVLDIIRAHRERQQEEEKKRLEARIQKKRTASISETGMGAGTHERKEEEDETTQITTSSLHLDLPEDSASEADSFPSGALYRALDRMIANCEFLLGGDGVRSALLGVGGSLPVSRAPSKPVSIKSSPMRGGGGAPDSASKDMLSGRSFAAALTPPTLTPRDSDDEDDETARSGDENEGGLLLRRVHSDLFASPIRGAAAGSLAQVSQFDLGAPAGLPTQVTPTNSRRMSDSAINIQQVLAAMHADRPGTGGADSAGLSSWTSTSVNPRMTPPMTDSDAPVEEATTLHAFEAEWLARLMSSDQRLSESIGAGIEWLTSTMQNRIKLLQLLNAAFQSGHTQELVDDVLEPCRQVIRDTQTSNSMRSNQDATQNVLLFFYQHLAQTLSRLDWQEPEASAPEPLSLLHTRSTPLMRPTIMMTLAGAQPSTGTATSLQRQRLRLVSSRIRTILAIFSMEVSPNDSELLLGSGLLSVLPKFSFRLHQAQLEHQRTLHARLYQPNGVHSKALAQISSASLSAPAVPSASTFWLIDDEVHLSSVAQSWSHQIFMYHCSSLLGLAPSRRTQQQRYVLASTLGRQLNSMVQDAIHKIQLTIATGFPFPTATSQETQPIAARVRSEDMSEFGLFPLQLGNPLSSGLRELDELIYRTVDMLNLLSRISSQEHSVCSRKHILFLLRVLRHDDVGTGRHVVLPSLVQMEIIKLLRRELTFHAPLASHPNPPTAASSTVNSPVAKPTARSSIFLTSPSSSPPLPPLAAPLMRTLSLLAEDVAYSDVNLALELLDTVASMQQQQQLFHFTAPQEQHRLDEDEVQRKRDQVSELEQKSPGPVRLPSRTSSGVTAAAPPRPTELTQAASASPPASSTSVPISVSSAVTPKEQQRQASFRRVGVLLCPSCGYVEFPACAQHKVFLTRQLLDGSAACPDETCTSNTATGAQWSRCLLCKKCRPSLSFWLVSEGEATYCATAIKNNHTPIIPHNVFLCSGCHVVEFPGTKTGGLTLNVDGKLYDHPTKRFLSTDLYRFTHFAPSCTGTVSLVPLRLSKEEATYLGRFIKRTPAIDTSVPLSEFGPGKGSVWKQGGQEEKTGSGPFSGHSSISVLGQLLGEPYAMQSWLPTAQAQQTALMEMINLMRVFLQPPAISQRDGDAKSESMVTHSSTSLRAQWRDALMPILHAAFYDASSAVAGISDADCFSHVSVKRALHSVLSLQVLGGLGESLSNGSKVQVRVGDTIITGVVQHYDPLLSTVSVAMKRSLANDGAATEKVGSDSAAQQQRAADVDVAALLHSLGLSNEVGSGFLGVFEFPVDQVMPISPSLPPPLTSFATAAGTTDFLRHARLLLTAEIEDSSVDVGEMKTSDADRASRAVRRGIHELILAQAQHHLLFVLMYYLPSWLHASSELSLEVLQLLASSLDRWRESPVSAQISLHPHEWPTVARLAAQQLTDQAWKMQQDPVYARRKKLAAQLTSPESQATANVLGDGVPPSTGSPLGTDSESSAAPTASGQGSLSLTRASSTAIVLGPESSDSEEEDESADSSISIGVSAPPAMPSLLQNLDRLTAMGFPTLSCRFALASTRGNLEASISVILERLNDEDSEVDENTANTAFEATIDRLGQRDAVEVYRAWQDTQAMVAALRQAEAVIGGDAPVAPPMTVAASATSYSSGAPLSVPGLPNPKSLSDAERRMLSVAPHIHMANRYAYSTEDPLEALVLATPLDNAAATSRALNTTTARPTEYTVEQDKMRLLASAKAGTLVGAELFIPPDAYDSTIGTRVGDKVGKKFPYKVGDTITIVDLVNKVCPAVVDDINEETNKIYLHYVGWSKKWDEWVEVDSKRIQPKFIVGDRLTLRDSVNKISEAVVAEVAIKENQLKLFVKYVGWSSKWDEWIPASSNRVLARHDKKTKNGDAASNAPHAALQKALGLSSHDALRLPPCPFDISNRVGVVEKVDLRSGEFTDDDGPLVLIKVVDESLCATVMLWMRLVLLRSTRPLAHQIPCHLHPIPSKPTIFNAATLQALHLDTTDLLQFAVAAQQKSLAIMAKRIVQEAVMQIARTSPTGADASVDTNGTPAKLAALSPISPLSPFLCHPDGVGSVPQLLRHMKLQDLLPLLCHPLCPSSLTSILAFSQSADLSFHAGGTLDTDRARLVATVAQLIVARWQMDQEPPSDATSLPDDAAPTINFEDDLFQLIESSSQALLHASTQLKLHQLTVVAPGQSMTVGLEAPSAEQANEEDEPEAPMTPFNLQLVSTMMDPVLSEVLAPKFSRDAVWTIRFFQDASHTVLLKEMSCTSDPQSRLVPPFVVSNPVFITASHSQKSLAKLKESKLAGSSKSAKAAQFSADEAQVSFSITPMTHNSLELMAVLSEAIVHIQRTQIATRAISAGAPAEASSASAPVGPSLSAALSATLSPLLQVMYEGLKDVAEAVSSVVSVPCNLKVRAYDTIALILASEILTNKAARDEKGARRKERDDDEEEAPAHEDLDVSWLVEAVLPEAKARFAAERGSFPLHSVYLQRLLELLLVGVRYEFMVTAHLAVDIGDDILDSAINTSELQFRSTLQKELPIVLTMEYLLLHAAHPAAHPPSNEDDSADPTECNCAWHQDLAISRDESQQAAAFLDFSPTSIVATLLYDLDCFPDLRSSELGLHRRPAVLSRPVLSHLSSLGSSVEHNDSNVSSLVVTPSTPSVALTALLAPSTDPTAGSFSAILHALNASLMQAAREADLASEDAQEEELSVPLATDATSSSSAAAPAVAAPLVAPTVPVAPPGWRSMVSLCDRLLPSSALRTRLLHLLLNGTSAPNLPRPEIAFRRGADVEEMTSITQAKHLYRSLPHTHLLPIASAESQEKRKKALLANDEALGRGNMFQQLVDAFLKSGLHAKPISLRAELGAVTFKCILSGVLDQGAAGLPGPFRQALAEISSFLNAEALDSASIESGSSLFIPTPNSRSQTGDDRNKLLLNPSLIQKGEISLVQCRIFGQLLGIAIRSKCCLNIDLASVFWKQLLEIPLAPSDLQSFDYTASKSLTFVDPSNDIAFTQEEFDDYLGYLSWTTVLSDATTQVELKPDGAHQKVHFHQRYEYAAKAIEARLHESALLVAAIREGLLSIIPKQCLHFLTWRELELRVCGRPTVDLAVLERHTVYSPSSYTRQSTPIIQWFWQILGEFTQDELAQFLQFCWARSRLPAEDQHGSYRMQLNILDATPKHSPIQANAGGAPAIGPNDMLLPTSETCFFNVNMPKYSNLETMRAKIKMALLCSTITS